MKVDIKEFDFRPAPFWFLNHELTEEEIVFQLDILKQAHVSGAFLHPRAGNYLQTYGSKEWFEKIEFICDQASKRGLKMWLYDEDPFPSGVAGGRVFLEHPEFRAYNMVLKKGMPDENGKVELKLGKGVILCAYAIKFNGKKSDRIDLYDSIGTIRGENFFRSSWQSPYYWDMMNKLKFSHVRAETQQAEMAIISTVPKDYVVFAVMATPVIEGKYGGFADLLNPKCTDRFIELTHEKYKKFSGHRFGKSVPGIFTDEPQICGGFPTMFSFTVFDEFEKAYGYDLKEKLVDVFEDLDCNSSKVREDYRRLIDNLLQKNFYKKLYDWCKKNGIYMTGHLAGEEALNAQPLSGQNFYQSILKYWDIPGLDFLGQNLGDNDHFALTVGGKLVSSVANQTGKPVILCEFAACNPYNYTIEGLERIAFYQLILGVNLLVPHGYHFSLEGFRKFDAGCSFSYQFRDFDKMAAFNEMIGKFGKLCAEGKDLSDVCVVMPYAYTYGANPKDNRVAEYRDVIVEACKKLTNRHIEYNLIDDLTLDKCPVVGNKVKVIKKEYTTIVAIKDTLSKGCLDKLNAVKLLDVKEIDGYSFSDVYRSCIEAINGDCLRIMVLKKRVGKKERYYIFNSGFGQVEFNLKIGAYSAKIYRPYIEDVMVKSADGIIHIVLGGCDAIMVEESNRPTNEVYACEKYTGEVKTYEFMTNPETDYVIYDRDNYVIEEYEMEFSSLKEEFKEKKTAKYGLIRERFVTLRNYMKTAPLPIFDVRDVKELEIYPVRAKFIARFNPKKKYEKMLIESTTFIGDCKIVLNGTEIKLNDFKTERVYDFRNKTLDVSKILIEGENVLTVEFARADEFEGITSRIYLI